MKKTFSSRKSVTTCGSLSNAIYLEVETFLALYEPNKEQEKTLINIQGHADRQQEMVSEIPRLSENHHGE